MGVDDETVLVRDRFDDVGVVARRAEVLFHEFDQAEMCRAVEAGVRQSVDEGVEDHGTSGDPGGGGVGGSRHGPIVHEGCDMGAGRVSGAAS